VCVFSGVTLADFAGVGWFAGVDFGKNTSKKAKPTPAKQRKHQQIHNPRVNEIPKSGSSF
jgi:hypothetical protein